MTTNGGNDEGGRWLVIDRSLRIPATELRFHYVRSSGPGGQRVNKVSTKAVLKWNVSSSPHLPEPVRSRFLRRFANRITRVGDVVLASDRFRDQRRNAQDCRDRLRKMLASTASPPKPRKATKPTAASKQRRLKSKQITARKKSLRGSPNWEE